MSEEIKIVEGGIVKKLLYDLKVSEKLPIFAAESPLDAKSLGQLWKNNLES